MHMAIGENRLHQGAGYNEQCGGKGYNGPTSCCLGSQSCACLRVEVWCFMLHPAIHTHLSCRMQGTKKTEHYSICSGL